MKTGPCVLSARLDVRGDPKTAHSCQKSTGSEKGAISPLHLLLLFLFFAFHTTLFCGSSKLAKRRYREALLRTLVF